MAQHFHTGFIAVDVAVTHRNFIRAIDEFRKLRSVNPALATETLTLLERSYRRFQRQLREAAVITAREATVMMREKENKTRVRPRTDNKMGLRRGLVAAPVIAPLESGAVGIADIDRLQRYTVNPRDPGGRYGAYWRVQEDGYSGHVGREVKGGFFTAGGGGPATPRGADFRRHPIFKPGPGGRMTINRPIRGRHFIRDTANELESVWLRRMARVQAESVAGIRVALLTGAAAGARRIKP